MNNSINLEYLYLDVSVCTRCQGSDLNLEEAVETLKSKYPSQEIDLDKIHINTIDVALEQKFVSSPTIRINGQDLPVEFKENNCDSCGDFCGDNVDCRIWVHDGVEYESAPTQMIVDLVSQYIDGRLELEAVDTTYSIPENVIHFFAARLKKEVAEVETKDSCGCSTLQLEETKEDKACCAPSTEKALCC